MKWLWDAFARLDADSQMRVTDLAFDDPTTVKRVRMLDSGTASCHCGKQGLQNAAHAAVAASYPASAIPSLPLHAQVPCPSVFGEPTKELSIIIPAYNEEDRLPATLTETLRCGSAGRCTVDGTAATPRSCRVCPPGQLPSRGRVCKHGRLRWL